MNEDLNQVQSTFKQPLGSQMTTLEPDEEKKPNFIKLTKRKSYQELEQEERQHIWEKRQQVKKAIQARATNAEAARLQ